MRTVTAAGLPIGDDHPPRIMGVLNVSEESPYDGSVHADPGEAAAYVDEALVSQGADIVDVGLQSANKRFEVLSAAAELDRLETAVETVASTSGDVVWSIETRYHEVADAALSAGFDMVNDVGGFADPEMPPVCADYDAAVSKMASPPDLKRPGAVGNGNRATGRGADPARRSGHADDVYEALARNGFTDKTLVDPAFGGWSTAKTLADDRETFDRLREFRGLGRPILVSINRKNFLKDVVDRDTDGALPTSLAATAMAVERGAHVVRTHDVAATRDAARIGHEFTRDRLRDPAAGVAELDVTTDAVFRRHLERVSGGDGVEVNDAVVTRVVEVDLPPVAAEHVATAARRAGIDVYGDETLLLVGEAPQFRSVDTASNDAPEAAERAIERLCGGFE
ncbi:dihydropteroate synthase [Halobacteriales archaeon QH_7_69_31]|nr:MAG: dihydropteroate synthase [Halobacteriales archaeon QH_7_69_31]